MSQAPLPPYTYVPGGPWPHPIREPGGHLFGREHPQPPPIPHEPTGEGSPVFDQGRQLFNAGYYWEAHESWESLWHAHGRTGPTADTLKALIKLAAAGVKIRENQAHGVLVHSQRAAGLFRSVSNQVGPRWLGLDLLSLAHHADDLSHRPLPEPIPLEAGAVVVMSFEC